MQKDGKSKHVQQDVAALSRQRLVFLQCQLAALQGALAVLQCHLALLRGAAAILQCLLALSQVALVSPQGTIHSSLFTLHSPQLGHRRLRQARTSLVWIQLVVTKDFRIGVDVFQSCEYLLQSFNLNGRSGVTIAPPLPSRGREFISLFAGCLARVATRIIRMWGWGRVLASTLIADAYRVAVPSGYVTSLHP